MFRKISTFVGMGLLVHSVYSGLTVKERSIHVVGKSCTTMKIGTIDLYSKKCKIFTNEWTLKTGPFFWGGPYKTDGFFDNLEIDKVYAVKTSGINCPTFNIYPNIIYVEELTCPGSLDNLTKNP